MWTSILFYVAGSLGLYVWYLSECDDISGGLWVVATVMGGFSLLMHFWDHFDSVKMTIFVVVHVVVIMLGLSTVNYLHLRNSRRRLND